MLQLYPIPAVFELQTILRQVHCMTQMTLNTKRSKVPHIHVATTTESQMSPCFVSILRQVQSPTAITAITPKITWNSKTPNELHIHVRTTP